MSTLCLENRRMKEFSMNKLCLALLACLPLAAHAGEGV
jgi:hypothetical protein